MHLGATYLKNPLEYEKRVVDWLMSVKDEAKAIYMLGDILDYWYEYRTVVPRGYVRFFGALATLADEGVKIYWFIGNHDIWLFDYLRDEIGLTVIDGYSEVTISSTQCPQKIPCRCWRLLLSHHTFPLWQRWQKARFRFRCALWKGSRPSLS